MIRDITGDVINKISILLYGAPGSGKTWFGLHMPKPYFISYDKGGLLGAKVHGKTPDGVEIDTFEDFNMVLGQIQTGQRAKSCETIVLDHLTEHTDQAIQFELRKSGKKKPDLAVWGSVVDSVRVSMKQLIDLQQQFHILVLAHEQVEKNDVRGGIFGTPYTVGKFAYHIGGMFNLFLFAEQEMEWKNGKQVPNWIIHTAQYIDFKAKDGIGRLDVVEPNDPELILGKIFSKEANDG